MPRGALAHARTSVYTLFRVINGIAAAELILAPMGSYLRVADAHRLRGYRDSAVRVRSRELRLKLHARAYRDLA